MLGFLILIIIVIILFYFILNKNSFIFIGDLFKWMMPTPNPLLKEDHYDDSDSMETAYSTMPLRKPMRNSNNSLINGKVKYIKYQREATPPAPLEINLDFLKGIEKEEKQRILNQKREEKQKRLEQRQRQQQRKGFTGFKYDPIERETKQTD